MIDKTRRTKPASTEADYNSCSPQGWVLVVSGTVRELKKLKKIINLTISIFITILQILIANSEQTVLLLHILRELILKY